MPRPSACLGACLSSTALASIRLSNPNLFYCDRWEVWPQMAFHGFGYELDDDDHGYSFDVQTHHPRGSRY